jgi:hypothetical protein
MARRKRIYGKRRKRSAFKKDNEPDWDKLNITATSKQNVAYDPKKHMMTEEQKKAAKEYYSKHGTPGSLKSRIKTASKDFMEKQRAHTLSDRVSAAADGVQVGLSGAGLIFPQADALNAVISSTRAGYAKSIGDDEGAKKHGLAAAVNTAAILPGAKELYKGTRAGNIMVQSATKQADDLYKVAKNIKNAKVLDVVGAGANLDYWRGTAKSIKDIASK